MMTKKEQARMAELEDAARINRALSWSIELEMRLARTLANVDRQIAEDEASR